MIRLELNSKTLVGCVSSWGTCFIVGSSNSLDCWVTMALFDLPRTRRAETPFVRSLISLSDITNLVVPLSTSGLGRLACISSRLNRLWIEKGLRSFVLGKTPARSITILLLVECTGLSALLDHRKYFVPFFNCSSELEIAPSLALLKYTAFTMISAVAVLPR
jgi:hypothetical protein